MDRFLSHDGVPDVDVGAQEGKAFPLEETADENAYRFVLNKRIHWGAGPKCLEPKMV